MNVQPPDLETFWLGALLAVPVAAGIALVCRLGVRSPATRHALWVVALLTFVAPGVVSMTAAPEWLEAARDSLHSTPIEAERVTSAHDRAATAETRRPDRWAGPPEANDSFFPALEQLAGSAASRSSHTPSPARAAQPDNRSASDAFFRIPRADSSGSVRSRPEATPESRPEPPLDVLSASSVVRPGFVSDDPPTIEDRLERARVQLATWGAWSKRLLVDALRIPPMPGLVWLAGVALALILVALRIARESTALRVSRQPTATDEQMLRAASKRIGLSRPPQLCFVTRRISPMVTCGPRRRLVVPDDLWQSLDDDARLAVLLHELAHLRRRDHWTHWLAVGIGLFYWWHPVAWYIRSRLADEADLACDAWVTALMPNRRRAYATALLEATTFAGTSPRRAGASLAMASSSTRRLTRRLTMVMTHTVRPRPGAMGRSLVAAAAVLALLVLPGVACPPDEKEPPRAPTPPAHEPHDAPDSTFDEHMRSRAAAPEGDGREARMARLADRMAELEGRLAQLGGGAKAPHAPSASKAPSAPHPAHAADATRYLGDRGFAFTAESDQTTARAYVLPRGRLEDLTRLMARSDVPILITPKDDRIVVHAIPRDHATFSGFAAMICPEGVKVIDVESGRVIEPHAAYSFGVVRPSVNVTAPGAPAHPRVAVYADRVHTEVHSDECDSERADSCDDACSEECDELKCDELEAHAHPTGRADHEHRAHLEAMRLRLRELDSSKHRLGERLTQSQRMQSDLERHLAQYERQAERMVDRAETARDRADELSDEAQDLADEAKDLRESGRADRAERAMARAAELRAKADQMRAQSDQFVAQADVARAQAHESERAHDQTEDQTDQIRDMIDALSDEIDAIRDALEDLAEDLAGAR